MCVRSGRVATTGVPDEGACRPFAGYTAVRLLLSAERQVWPAVRRAAALRFWLFPPEVRHQPRPGEVVTIKNLMISRRLCLPCALLGRNSPLASAHERNSCIFLAPHRFTGDSREVDPGACLTGCARWASVPGQSRHLDRRHAAALVILMAIPSCRCSQIAAHLLVPLFGAGMFHVCRRISDNEELVIADLFAGFHHQAGQLVMVGVFFALGIFGIAFIAFLLVSGGVLGGVVTGKVAGFGIALGGVMLAGLLVLVLSVPVIMATWFAPALVYFTT